jgi:hypothetical protein
VSGYWRGVVDMIMARLLADERMTRATDEEFVDYLIKVAPPSLAFPDFERRMLVEEVSERRRAPGSLAATDIATPEAVRAERERRKASHEPHGYGALAKHFHVDQSTIRRRLGVL